MILVDVICSFLLNSIIRPMIPCGMRPNFRLLCVFHIVNGIQNRLDCPIKWFSFKLNSHSRVTFASIYPFISFLLV